MIPIRNTAGERLDVSFHNAEKSDCLVILGHGLTGNKDRSLLVELADALAENGWPCLRITYSGNGESEGAFTESNITKEVADLSAIIDQVGSGKRIAYIGHSMGGAVGALFAARDERVKIMVSLAGMVYTADFVKREFGDIIPDEGLMWDEPGCTLSKAYVEDLEEIGDTLAAAKEIRIPWLLIHGSADDIIPPRDSEDLFKVLRRPSALLEIEGAGHSFENHYSKLTVSISDWLEKYF